MIVSREEDDSGDSDLLMGFSSEEDDKKTKTTGKDEFEKAAMRAAEKIMPSARCAMMSLTKVMKKPASHCRVVDTKGPLGFIKEHKCLSERARPIAYDPPPSEEAVF